MTGGYAMVDCSELDLNTLGTVTGLYEKVKAAISTDKPLVLFGIVNDEQEFSPIVAFGGIESDSSVFVSFFPVTLHISEEDVVTM